tara:strand:- start:113 stop:724 length:612 start_codon:yes stop_codon:yes gene_type:complete
MKELAIRLSKLKGFENPQIQLEQYPTDSNIAARIIHYAYTNKDIDGKNIVDLGCGYGILGLGALLMNAASVVFVDSDPEAIRTCKHNFDVLKDKFEISENVKFVCSDVNDYDVECDTVIMNPPFGTKTKHADLIFLEKAFQLAQVVYTIHKEVTKNYILETATKYGYKLCRLEKIRFSLQATMKMHKKKVQDIQVALFHFVKE